MMDNLQVNSFVGFDSTLYPNVNINIDKTATGMKFSAKTYVRTLVNTIWYVVPVVNVYELGKSEPDKDTEMRVLRELNRRINLEAYKVQLFFNIPGSILDSHSRPLFYIDRSQISEEHRILHGYPVMDTVVEFGSIKLEEIVVRPMPGKIMIDVADLIRIQRLEYEL